MTDSIVKFKSQFSRFKFVTKGQTAGLAFDGLIYVNNRWVLMPKPWRALN